MNLTEQLAEHTRPAELFEHGDGTLVRCLACGHRCPIPAGFGGVCKVRFNRQGTLYAPHGYVNTLQVDPIEKKPFYHVLPGARTFSFGMLGCSFHCSYCQNWLTSQALRDVRSTLAFQPMDPGTIIRQAQLAQAAAVVSTYNEPLITSEWAVAVFKEARKAGLVTGFVSNGNATPEALAYLRPWLDLFKVDLKCFDKRHYRDLGARLGPVLDSIGRIYQMGFWLEVVTLVVPGFNDSSAELKQAARFLAGISRDIPWHLIPFRPDYKMSQIESTPDGTLKRAADIGEEAGLRYVYPSLSERQDTKCPGCGSLLVKRRGYQVAECRVSADGQCPECGAQIPGVWSNELLHSTDHSGHVFDRCG